MPNVSPFRAVIPAPERAAEVSCPPYDVLTADEAAQLADESHRSFVHVSRPEVDLAPEDAPGCDALYHKAKENYETLRRSTPFSQDDRAALYVYALEMAGHRQEGVAATVALDDYESGIVRRHEKTTPDKVEDRARHIAALRAQTGPVLLAYRDCCEVDRLVSETTASPELFDFRARDGVRHVLWRVPAHVREPLRGALGHVPFAYVADGHHRAESASRVRQILRGQNGAHDGTEEYNRFLAVLFPASQLHILPYNRAVRGLNGRTQGQFLD